MAILSPTRQSSHRQPSNQLSGLAAARRGEARALARKPTSAHRTSLLAAADETRGGARRVHFQTGDNDDAFIQGGR